MKYRVRDGFVQEGDAFYWLCDEGPKAIDLNSWREHKRNIENYPEAYQKKKPVYVPRPGSDYLVVYEHEESYKHMQKGRKVVKTKHERKRPEFTFEDGVELAQDTCVHSGFLIVATRYEDVFTDKDRLLAAQEYLRNTNYFNKYGYKPLRKKLKLYIKWLQSEMSKLESSKQGE